MKIYALVLLVLFFLCSDILFSQYMSPPLQGSHKNTYTKVEPPSTFSNRQVLGKVATASFDIHYDDNDSLPLDPGKKVAIEYAVNIWKFIINTAVGQTIKINVKNKNLGYSSTDAYTLAQCGPDTLYNSAALPHNVQYPIALAEHLLGENLNGNDYDIQLEINCHDSINWYYGTDGIPHGDQPDLVTTVLHEIAHGLGFGSSFSVSGNYGYRGFSGYPIDAATHPTIYDIFVASGRNYPATTLLINDPNSSTELKTKLISNNVFFSGENAWVQNGRDSLPKLYTPTSWQQGSSIAHLDDTTYPSGNRNSLMTHEQQNAEVIHSPGEVGLAILKDLGWSINRLATFTHPSFDVAVKKGTVDTIKWFDTDGGSYRLDLLDSLDNYLMYVCLQGMANDGLNNYMWPVPTNLPNGKYRIKISNGNDQFGLTSIFTISDQDQVVMPVFSPNGGEFNSTQQVWISCATSGAEIRYTVNGDEPNQQTGILYNNQTPIVLTSTKILIAKAFKIGWVPSMATPPAIFEEKSGTKIAQVDENGIEFGIFGFWQPVYHSWNYGFQNPSVFALSQSSYKWQVVKADQNYKSNTTEKWNVWQSDATPYWVNFANVGWNSTPPNEIIAHFKKAYNTGFSANGENTITISDSISFKDPWLIDDYSQDAGKRNRGVGATFYTKQTPFTISTSDTFYKGVFLNQGWPTWTPPYYSVKASQIQNINLGGALGTRTFYFQNWSGTNVNFQDVNALETPLVFTNDGAVATANYKGHLLSNNSAGFSSNSQRKFISDANGNKHLVYESQGSVWYTKSTDNGTTWQPEVKINAEGTQAKGATMATSTDGYLYVLYQCDRGLGINTNPTLVLSQYYYGTLRWQTEVCDLSSYSYNSTAVISAINGVVLVVYKPNATSVLVGKEYLLSAGNVAQTYVRNISGTTQNSLNPSLATNQDISPKKHMLVYQESYGTIYYKELTVATDLTNTITSNLSSGSGYSVNYTPSIVDFSTGARTCWVGSGATTKVVFRDPGNLYQSWTFGTSVSSPSIGKKDNNTAYYLGWSESGSSFKIADNHLSESYLYMKSLTGLQGSAIQLSNGSTASSMFAMTFNTASSPYALTQSASIGSYYGINKENANSNIASGRGGIIMKGEAEFFFMLGDIEVNGEKIRFKQLSDTVTIPSKDVLNTLIESEPFELKDNSMFTYSVEYGITDSTLAAQVLQNNENVKFKVELIDVTSDQIINTFDNVSYSKDFLQKYTSIAYQVNTEAISTMGVKLRLVADHSGNANYFINNSFVENEIIAKKGFKVINVKVDLQIKDYALTQNYPNPFNPITTITYQLPKSGSVTLKIFDILGNEIKTLVNEQKEKGRYTVQFDASSLASGMYVYQLRANDYTSTKKMLLLK